VLWFAAESGDGGGGVGDMGVLAQYGVLGVFAILLIVFAKVSYKREVDRADRLEQEVVRLNNLIIERVIPALSSATNIVEDATELLRSMQRERELAHIQDRVGPPTRRRNETE
jgi:hypothetical protein